MNAPIPLKADYGHANRAAMQSLCRAVLSVGLRALSRYERLSSRMLPSVIGSPGGCFGAIDVLLSTKEKPSAGLG